VLGERREGYAPIIPHLLSQEEGDEDDGLPVPWVEGEGGGGDDTVDIDQGNNITLR